MSDIYTNVQNIYLCNGRVPRQQAIAEARKHFEQQLHEAQAFLALEDAQISVLVVRGTYRQKVIEYLMPVHSEIP